LVSLQKEIWEKPHLHPGLTWEPGCKLTGSEFWTYDVTWRSWPGGFWPSDPMTRPGHWVFWNNIWTTAW